MADGGWRMACGLESDAGEFFVRAEFGGGHEQYPNAAVTLTVDGKSNNEI